jgi:hypothetical protein
LKTLQFWMKLRLRCNRSVTLSDVTFSGNRFCEGKSLAVLRA